MENLLENYRKKLYSLDISTNKRKKPKIGYVSQIRFIHFNILDILKKTNENGCNDEEISIENEIIDDLTKKFDSLRFK